MQLVRMSIYSLGKPREYKHNFNSFDKAIIKSDNIDIHFVLLQIPKDYCTMQ